MSQILITGGTGFIASQIIKLFLSNGFTVKTSVRDIQNKNKTNALYSLCSLCSVSKDKLQLIEADLLQSDPWSSAVDNCSIVIHVASPFPAVSPKNEDELIRPAVNGTLNVLKACSENDHVKKVVLTSSVASISGGFQGGGPFKEDNWTNVDDKNLTPYVKSKALAEKAAWDFVEKRLKENKKCFDLVAINPSFVLGPILCGTQTTSMEPIKRILERSMPLLPHLNFSVVDVRDVAKAHYIAATNDNIKNNRYILHNCNVWMSDIANILSTEFDWQGYNVPTKTSPNFLIKLFSIFDSTIGSIVPMLNVETKFNNYRMINELKIKPIAIEKTITDMAYSMIEAGFIKKTGNYGGVPAGIDVNNSQI